MGSACSSTEEPASNVEALRAYPRADQVKVHSSQFGVERHERTVDDVTTEAPTIQKVSCPVGESVTAPPPTTTSQPSCWHHKVRPGALQQPHQNLLHTSHGSTPHLGEMSLECGRESGTPRRLSLVAIVSGGGDEFAVPGGNDRGGQQRSIHHQFGGLVARDTLTSLKPLVVHSSAFSLDSGKVSATERMAAEAQFNREQNINPLALPDEPQDDWGTDDQRRIMMASFYGITPAQLSAARDRPIPDLLHDLSLSTVDSVTSQICVRRTV